MALDALSPGAYDDGYRRVPCFWGRAPGSLVQAFVESRSVAGMNVLDAGAGEGKNAVFLASRGADVLAVEISAPALANAASAWPGISRVTWLRGDIRTVPLVVGTYGLVIAYGLYHCLRSRDDVIAVIMRLMEATVTGGHHIVCCFNSRNHDLTAHPDFEPCLLSHDELLGFYEGWSIKIRSDSDLHETHPHNNIPHVHSMTRFIAQKP